MGFQRVVKDVLHKKLAAWTGRLAGKQNPSDGNRDAVAEFEAA
jgi:hypothetical protein